MSERKSSIAIGLSIGLVLAAAPAFAAESYVFKPFFNVTYAMPTDNTQARVGALTGDVELSDESGWEAGLEWRFGRFLGLEAAYGQTDHEINFGDLHFADAEAGAIYVGLNFHVFPAQSFDLYIAPTYVMVDWQKDGIPAPIPEGDNSDGGFGVTVGIDWPLGETWALTGGLRYFDTQIGLGANGSFAVDPLVLRFGVAARL
jgi:hypothetical protein